MSRRPLVIAFPRKLHGLGNRVRVVLGARSLARHTGRQFAYTWPTGRAFGARFDELWEFPERRISVLTSKVLSLRHPYRREDLEWMPAAASDPVWQIRTPHALHLPEGAVSWGEELRRLRPVAPVAERITDFHATHFGDAPYIGVMIRTHSVSNTETLQRSPLEWYLDRMSAIRAERPGIRFFVSADTPTAQATVLERIPHSFALTDKGGYNTKQALRSSVIDLYLLASSSHLLGPHFSSFPEMAQHLGGATLRLETSMTDESRRFDSGAPLIRVRDALVPAARETVEN